MSDIDFLRLVSFQVPGLWNALRRNGGLMVDSTRVYPDFREYTGGWSGGSESGCPGTGAAGRCGHDCRGRGGLSCLFLQGEDKAWEARLPCAPRWRGLPLRFKKAVVRLWERIFDLGLMARSWWAEGRQRVRAVLGETKEIKL